MARAHVYSDPIWLTSERKAEKRGVTGAKGARHAAVRFVTGALDPFMDRVGFLAAGGALREPTLVIYGADAPPKSRAEMEMLSALPSIATRVLSRGKLNLHEEFPDEVAAAISEGLAAAT